MRFVYLGLSLALGLSACGGSMDGAADAGSAGSVAAPAGQVDVSALDARMEAWMETYQPVGYSVAVLRGQEVVYTRHGGVERVDGNEPTDGDTLYSVFSVAKLPFTLAVFQAVERGELELDAPIGRYVSDLPEDWQDITLSQLLSHTSGLPEYYSHPDVPPTVEAAFDRILTAPMLNETGDVSRYNQTNFLLVKLALEAVTGRDYAEIVQTDQYDRLGMDNTVYGGLALADAGRVVSYRGRDEQGDILTQDYPAYPPYVYASVGLNTTLDDMTLWAQALDSGDLAARDALMRFWQPIPMNNGHTGWFSNGWEYGDLGAFTRVGHGGAGRVNLYHFFPKDRPDDAVTVVYLDNGGAINAPHRRLANLLADIVMPGVASERDRALDTVMRVFLTEEWSVTEARLDDLRAAPDAVPGGVESLVNTLGYDIFYMVDPESSVRMFRYNTERFPESANAFDSLGEAYRATGQLDLAHAAYTRALALDPGNARIQGVLAELEADRSEAD